jgi:DNA replication protein DnaC
MTNETTIQKLIEMRLPAMAEAFRDQQQEHTWEQCSFEERFGLLVDLEFTKRKNNRLKRLVQQAGFAQTQACVADINFTPVRKLDKATIERLATCQYIEQGHNVIFLGPSGAGKSYLACAFGMEACKHYYSVKYMRLPELLTEMAIDRGEGNHKKCFYNTAR